MNFGRALAALSVGSLASAVVAYKLCAPKVLLASTMQSFEDLKIDPAANGDVHKIIIICGWGGAQPKHLRRLQEMYNRKGYATIVVLPSMLPFLENGGCLGSTAELLLILRNHIRQLPDDLKPKVRIIFHTHSNTASFFCYLAVRLMRFEMFRDVALAYSGIINDSNLGHPSLVTIKPPKEFGKVLNTFLEANPLATTPLRLDEIAKQYPLPLGGSWKSYAFGANNSLYSWSYFSFVMAAVITPLVLKRNDYFHWFWTPICFLVCFKEYAHTTISNFIKHRVVRDPAPVATRFSALLTPHSIPSMDAVAEEISQSAGDGCFGDKQKALHILTGVINYDVLLNTDIISPMNVPELLLYSQGDKLVPARDTERYIYARLASQYKDKAPIMFVHKFEKSPHVAHFLKEPEVYTQCVESFFTVGQYQQDYQYQQILSAGSATSKV